MSECIGVTVSHDIAGCVFEHKCGSCVSGTEGPKAFPGAGAQRVEGKVRNGWGIQGRGSWALTFLYISRTGTEAALLSPLLVLLCLWLPFQIWGGLFPSQGLSGRGWDWRRAGEGGRRGPG